MLFIVKNNKRMAFPNPQNPRHSSSLKSSTAHHIIWSELKDSCTWIRSTKIAMIETVSLDYLVPSWWEIKVTVAASLFVILAYWYFTHRACGDANSDRSLIDNTSGLVDAVVVKEKVTSINSDNFFSQFDQICLNFCWFPFLFFPIMIEGQCKSFHSS